MSSKQAAIYARVSTREQAQRQTIDSQLEALRQRAGEDGAELEKELEFIDDGYTGSTLMRPGLERLRDLVWEGAVDRLYVHSPDRLARKYSFQSVLVEELQNSGVEVIFLNRELKQTPEDELLLQVQGVIAEYERAKIIERNRRGKRHAARIGKVSALGGAPYGYRYVNKQQGGGQARYEVIDEQARVVRQMFDWIGSERVSIQEVTRRLASAGESTRKGNSYWDRGTIWGMLKNPAYKGEAIFGRTRTGQRRPQLRPHRGHSQQPRRERSYYRAPSQEWIRIPVPAIVEPEMFEMVQDQLRKNQRQSCLRPQGEKYLLQGLIVCKECGYAYSGVTQKSPAASAGGYTYYRCSGADRYRFVEQKVCSNPAVRADKLESAVWQEVTGVLEQPERVSEEYSRRLKAPDRQSELGAIQTRIRHLGQGRSRLIDIYAEGLIDKKDFEPQIMRIKERIAKLEAEADQVASEETLQNELRLIVGRLEDFGEKIKGRLVEADWLTKRDVTRTLVKRVEVSRSQVEVVFRVQPPFDQRPDRGVLQDCRRVSRAARTFLLKHTSNREVITSAIQSETACPPFRARD